MKICEVELIYGHLYRHDDGGLYLLSNAGFFVNIKTGNVWSSYRPNSLTDVTDKYCLKEI